MEVLLNRYLSDLHLYKSIRWAAGFLALPLFIILFLYSSFIAISVGIVIFSIFNFELDMSGMNWNIPDIVDGYKLVSDWLFFMLLIIVVWFFHRTLRVALGKPFYIEKSGKRAYFILKIAKNYTFLYLIVLAIIFMNSNYPIGEDDPGESIVGHGMIDYQGKKVELKQAFIKKSPNDLYRYRVSFLPVEITGIDNYNKIEIYFDIISFEYSSFGMGWIKMMDDDRYDETNGVGIHRLHVAVKEDQDHYNLGIKTNYCLGCDYINSDIQIEIPKSIMKRY